MIVGNLTDDSRENCKQSGIYSFNFKNDYAAKLYKIKNCPVKKEELYILEQPDPNR